MEPFRLALSSCQFFGDRLARVAHVDELAGGRVHDDMDEPAVAMQQGDFVDEFVANAAELGRKRLRLELRGRRFQHGERLEQVMGLDLLAGFARRQAGRLGATRTSASLGASAASRPTAQGRGRGHRRLTRHAAVFPRRA